MIVATCFLMNMMTYVTLIGNIYAVIVRDNRHVPHERNKTMTMPREI